MLYIISSIIYVVYYIKYILCLDQTINTIYI